MRSEKNIDIKIIDIKINKKGFTLVEVLVCITIMGVLALMISGFVRLLYESKVITNASNNQITYTDSNEEDNEMYYNFLNDTNKIKEYQSTIKIGDNNDIFLYSTGGSMYLKYQDHLFINGIEYPFIYQNYEYFSNQLVISFTYQSNTYYLIIYGTKI